MNAVVKEPTRHWLSIKDYCRMAEVGIIAIVDCFTLLTLRVSDIPREASSLEPWFPRLFQYYR